MKHLFLVSFDLLPQQISWYVKVRLLFKLCLSLLLDIYKKIFHFFAFFSCYLLISLFRKYFLRNNSFFGVFFAAGTLDVFVVRRCGGGGGGVGDRRGGDCNTPVLCLHLVTANHTYHASSSILILHA